MKHALLNKDGRPHYVLISAAVLLVFIAGLVIGLIHTAEVEHDHQLVQDEIGGDMVWTCSMHPQVRQPGPGQCPICGMDLIPVATDDDPIEAEAELPRLSVSERAAALMQVQIWPVERRSAEGDVHLSGRLTYDERRVIDVVVRSGGVVEHLYVDYMHAPVRAGQPLAEFYSPTVVAAAEQLLVARQAAERSDRGGVLDSARRKLELLGVSQGQIDQILDTGEVPQTYTIFSPIGGYLAEMGGHAGHWLDEGEHLAEIVDNSVLWVMLDAYESDIGRLETGQRLSFTTESFPGERFQARIEFIEPVLMGNQRVTRIRATVPNPDRRLKPGMFAQGTVASTAYRSPDEPLLIPASAPLITGRRAVVYVQLRGTDRPTFEGRTVELGPRAGDYFVVRSGLSEGELVVTNGNFKIDSELQIRGRPSMMAPDGQIPMPLHDHGPPLPTPADEPEPHFHNEMQSVDVSPEVGAHLAHLVREYFHVVQTLANDEKWGAEASLRRLRDAYRAVDADRYPNAAREPWQNIRREAKRVIYGALASEDMENYRDHLQPLTHVVETTIRNFRTDELPVIYEVYCPMAHDDRGGTWLQAHNRIENPYFGPVMYRCGEIRGEVR